MRPETISLIATIAGIVLLVVINTLVLAFVPRNRRPQTALAWILAIYFLPGLGILLFFIAGSHRLPRGRRDRQAEVSRIILETTEGSDRVGSAWPSELAKITRLNRELGSMPVIGGNSARLWADDADALAAMIAAVDGARETVHSEFYIMSYDATTLPYLDALTAAKRRGVTVRVLLDHLGSARYPGYRKLVRRLRADGIEWHRMLPFAPLEGKVQRPDLRNHRKILVIDGRVAFTGSQNIIEERYQRGGAHVWRDLMVRFEGPVVAALDALFLTDWYAETGELLRDEAYVPPQRPGGDLDCQVVPSGPGFDGENNLRMLNSLVYAARSRIAIVTPYLVPDDSMLYALTTAAQSGIEVVVYVPELGDQFWASHAQHSYYEALLRAGVRLLLYRAPVVLHGKFMTVDEDVAVIGSSNLDMRSFTLDLEVSVLVRGASFLAALRGVEDDYRGNSRELTLAEWSSRSWFHHVKDAVARLTAAVQ